MPDRAAIQVDGEVVRGIDLSGATISSCNAIVLGAGTRIALTDAGPFIGFGSGSPANVYAWPPGSIWIRTDTTSTSMLYVKQSATAATSGWTLK